MSIQTYAFIDGIDPVSAADHVTKNYVDLTRKVPHVIAYRTAAFTMSSSAGTATNPFIFDTRLAGTDPGNNYNTSTGIYTCPIAGIYLMRVAVSIGMTVVGTVTTGWYFNTSNQIAVTNTYQGTGTQATVSEATTTRLLNAGDTLQAYAATSQASGTGRAVASETNMTIVWLAGGSL